jgi:hypothetical protein
MDQELQALVDECNDPRLIRGIHNYCHRWCERCSFTDRCSVFRETSKYERDHPGSDPLDQVKDSLEKTMALLAAWCEREGIDFEKIRDGDESAGDESVEETMELSTTDLRDVDPLLKSAREYGRRAFEIVLALEAAERLSNWSAEVRSAIDTIAWYSSFIPVKVHRALHGHVEAGLDEPILQSDWNLTAKAARMAIAESIRAWKIVLEAGDAPAQSPLRDLVDCLTSIDGDLTDRFPRAMEGVRPGFDEPDVAAGQLTTLDCFELRSWQREEKREIQN